MHECLIEDENGELVDAIPLCSDFCHRAYCEEHGIEYQGWNGCKEPDLESITKCAHCDDTIYDWRDGGMDDA